MSSPSYTSSAQEIDPAVQSPAREQHSNLELKNLPRWKKNCQQLVEVQYIKTFEKEQRV